MNATQSKPVVKEKRECHLNDDIYWEIVDDDNEYDGTIHVVSTYDGSMMKISVEDVVKQLKQIGVV